VHDSPISGHPGISNTWDLVKRNYKGPQLCKFVEDYVKGCATCQESKVITHMKHTPLYHLNTFVEQGPFQYVSMDLITDLPTSNTFDSILTSVSAALARLQLKPEPESAPIPAELSHWQSQPQI